MNLYLTHTLDDAHRNVAVQFRAAARGFGHAVQVDAGDDEATQPALQRCRLVVGLVTSAKYDRVVRVVQAAVALGKPVLLFVDEAVTLPALPDGVEAEPFGRWLEPDTSRAIRCVCQLLRHVSRSMTPRAQN